MAKPLQSNGKSGSNAIAGTGLGEHLNGGAQADTIIALAGNDKINAGSGNDTMDGGAGSDIVFGDSGNDTGIYVASENKDGSGRYSDVYDGGSGNDTLRLVLTTAEWLNPVLQQEIDAYLAFISQNTLPNGEVKNVEFTFTSLNLRVSRFENLELVVDGHPVDPNDCNDGLDKFIVDENSIVIHGTDGDDVIKATDVSETIFGGEGNDVIAGRGASDQLSGGNGNDRLVGDDGDGILSGGAGEDLLLGNAGHDQIYGGCDNDTVRGGEDNDVVDGGGGNDAIWGDEGDDILIGGGGDDTFLLRTGDGADVIEDFDLSSDRIDLSRLSDAYDTYGEVMAAASETLDGVLFQFGSGDSLLVENVSLSDLTSDYFVF